MASLRYTQIRSTPGNTIEKNPMDKVRSVGECAADKVKFFTLEQATEFLSYIEFPYKVKTKGHRRTDDTGKEYIVGDYETTREVSEQLRVLFNLAIYSGLRKGELLALEWSDIDFEKDEITVSKSVSVVGGKQITKEPKTKTSRRSVTIPHFLTRRLKALQLERTRYRLSLGDYWQGENWLFIQDNGKQMSYYTPYSAFQDIISRYNEDRRDNEQLPAIPFHGLRHTSATLMIAGHQDLRTVSSRLGHAQASTTMNIYAHALKENDRKAASALENMLRERV